MKEDKRPIFTIRIVYKSGYTHDFECYSFELNKREATWEPADPTRRPILLGLDDVAAVWQIGVKQ